MFSSILCIPLYQYAMSSGLEYKIKSHVFWYSKQYKSGSHLTILISPFFFFLLDIAFSNIPQNPCGVPSTSTDYLIHTACNEKQAIFQMETKLLLKRVNEYWLVTGWPKQMCTIFPRILKKKGLWISGIVFLVYHIVAASFIWRIELYKTN